MHVGEKNTICNFSSFTSNVWAVVQVWHVLLWKKKIDHRDLASLCSTGPTLNIQMSTEQENSPRQVAAFV